MDTISVVKQLTNTLRKIAALPVKQHPERRFRELRQLPGEKDSAYRVRALAVIGSWWDRSANTVRSMEDGGRNGKDAPKFLADLHTYGGVRFDDSGAIIAGTLNAGPDPFSYIQSLPARKRPTSART
jgi:hypothetical protein